MRASESRRREARCLFFQTNPVAAATALAAIGVRLNAAKSYYAPSPTVANIQPMTFIALDSEGVLREQQMALVPSYEAARCLGVWFSFLGPASHTDGRWAHQIKKTYGRHRFILF